MTNDLITTRCGQRERTARIVLIVLGVLAVAAVSVVLLGSRKPPQMGPDPEVFAAVDALFTAVTARDEATLTVCEGRLHAHRDAGRLPAEAAAYLEGVIAAAHRGRWQAAAERLYAFASVQRRDGADGISPPGKPHKP